MANNPALSHPEYRPDIDGLRAVAVLSVLAFHVFPEICSGGYVGVDIFFVISGYLISSIIIGSLALERFSYATFYARRIRRIFPALLLVLTACLVVGWLELFPDEFRSLGRHVFLGATFVANLGLLREAGYFDQQANVKVLLHLWSLGIEEQFYIFWPLLLAMAFRWRTRLLALVLLATGASFLTNVWLISAHPEAAFYLPTSRLWELSIGAALACVGLLQKAQPATLREGTAIADQPVDEESLQRRKQFTMTASSVTGFALILISIFGLNSTLAFPGWWALLPCVGAVLLIASGPLAVINRGLLATPVCVWFGLISYPLYLWHWPILTFARILNNGPPSIAVRLTVVALSVLLAWATYVLIERPLRFQFAIRRLPVYLSVALGVVAAAGLAVVLARGVPGRSAANTLTPGIERTASTLQDPHSLPAATNCLDQFRSGDVDRCASNTGTPQIVVLGDSHAGHFYSGLVATQLPLAVIWNSGCPPTFALSLGNDCARRWHVLIDYVKAHKESLRLVALAIDYSLYTEATSLSGHANREHEAIVREAKSKGMSPNAQDILLAGFKAVISALTEVGVRVALIADTPALRHPASACLRRQFVPLSTTDFCMPVPRAAVERQKAAEFAIEGQLLHWEPRLTMFDPMPFFCDGDGCRPVLKNRLLYWDDNHLNEDGSKLIAKPLSEWLDSLL